MNHWQLAGRGLRALEAITDGLPVGKTPNFTTRGPTERLRQMPSGIRAKSAPIDFCVATGAWPIAAFWGAHVAIALAGILTGGGGIWLLWLALGLFGILRQTSNVMRINSQRIVLREGIAGRAERTIALAQLSAVWLQQENLGRVLNFGRIGMRLTTGETVWGPVIANPVLAKRAIAMAAGKRSLSLDAPAN